MRRVLAGGLIQQLINSRDLPMAAALSVLLLFFGGVVPVLAYVCPMLTGVLMVVLVVITTLAAITTGSGNAPFYAFVELIPKLAVHSGINPAFLAIPMLQASNLGRTVSPVAGVVVACAGMGKISPFEIVKRTSVPVAVGLVVVLMGTVVLVPM